MTYEDVKRTREKPALNDTDNAELQEMIDVAIEKQIPKKVSISIKYTRIGYAADFQCPNCRAFVSNGKYCSNCGQALKWGAKNE